MKEIVAAMIGNYITNDPGEISKALECGAVTKFLDRKHMEMMAAMDLGIRWEGLARSRTLFCLDPEGRPHAAKGE